MDNSTWFGSVELDIDDATKRVDRIVDAMEGLSGRQALVVLACVQAAVVSATSPETEIDG